ncbi:MoxR family ATPase [Dactylosporangium sp. NPDC050588]|uniref:AAA family ATPase n=1 Tax=Dactylosporangium sp. NPDC050588 TaxID=3157211 RepID=UPI0033EB359C
MLTRHSVDTSLRFDRLAELPDRRDIEAAGSSGPQPRFESRQREPYRASAELEEAVNVAIALGRPLLLQGDPGAGKTRLAHAVSFALSLPLEEAYIKSTSRGQDLLYVYDAVRRLYDTQLGRGVGRRLGRSAPDERDYVRLGPLGRAIVRAGHGRRSMVLIDEIDKADIDFPNDLLRELDQLAFDVPEAHGERHAVPADRPDLRPVIVVTNNEEKALPAAFLRRCVFHHVRFPDAAAELDAILTLHGIGDVQLRAEAIDTLLRLRALDLAKKPGLSELLDWVSYLQAVGARPGHGRLPFAGALVKQHSDALRLER